MLSFPRREFYRSEWPSVHVQCGPPMCSRSDASSKPDCMRVLIVSASMHRLRLSVLAHRRRRSTGYRSVLSAIRHSLLTPLLRLSHKPHLNFCTPFDPELHASGIQNIHFSDAPDFDRYFASLALSHCALYGMVWYTSRARRDNVKQEASS